MSFFILTYMSVFPKKITLTSNAENLSLETLYKKVFIEHYFFLFSVLFLQKRYYIGIMMFRSQNYLCNSEIVTNGSGL
jgi:hypothetical protein